MYSVTDKPKGKNPGKLFEEDFRKSTPPEVFVHRVKDAGSDKQHLFGVRNECDYIMYQHPRLYLLELKSHKGKSIPIGALTDVQVAGLNERSFRPGVVSGFLFNYRDLEETYFVKAGRVHEFIQCGQRKSFPVDWCREVGKRVDQVKLRTRYRYDVDKLLRDVV